MNIPPSPTSGNRVWLGEAAGAFSQGLADGAAAERERWRAILAAHYLAGIECDHERKLDNPICGCSRIHLGWHPSAGAARQAWIDHVTGLIEEDQL